MSKKKSKVAKQKQQKAKSLTKKRKQISSQYNIPLVTSKHNKQNNSNNKSSANNEHIEGVQLTGLTGSITSVGRQNKTPHNSPMHRLNGKIIGKGKEKLRIINQAMNLKKEQQQIKTVVDTEQQDFMKEFKSLQERTYYKEQQRQRAKNKSSKSSRSGFEFAKPNFVVGKQLTTDELLIQTTSQFNQQIFMKYENNQNQDMISSLVVNGPNNNDDNTQNDKQTLLQRLAAEQRKQQRMQMYLTNKNDSQQNQTLEESMKQNSFWALHDDEGDTDDEGKSNTQIPHGNPLNFAAPSFTVPSNNAFCNHHEEDDPDL